MSARTPILDPEADTVDDRALGCSLRVVVREPQSLARAKAAVDAVLLDIDGACSRFRADSELSRLNASPDRVVRLSPLLASALAVALRAARISDGAVDPTVGTALRLAGYDRDFLDVAPEGAPIRLRAIPAAGWRCLVFDPHTRLAMVPPGVELDLGATAKALAAQLASEAAAAAVGGGVLVSLGGDISIRGPVPAGGWQIQVSEDSGAPISGAAEAVRLGECGIATSSTTVRRWRRGGVELHHLIDPRTGLPVTGPWRTVTVVAATCVDANTAATAAIVKGPAAIDWLQAAGLPARLVDQAGGVTRLGDWPRPTGQRR